MRVVLCIQKRDLALYLKREFEQIGCEVFLGMSLYEAMQYAEKELPQLIVTESSVSDGHAGMLFDQLQGHQLLKAIPVFCVLSRKTKSEVAPLVGRAFLGAAIGKPPIKVVLNKVQQFYSEKPFSTPFFMRPDDYGIATQVSIAADAYVLGGQGGFVFLDVGKGLNSQSTYEIQVCDQDQLRQVRLSHPRYITLKSKRVINAFPIRSMEGDGCVWLHDAIRKSSSSEVKKFKQRVLFFDEGWQVFLSEVEKNYVAQALAAYNIVIDVAKDREELQQKLRESAKLPYHSFVLIHRQERADVHTATAYLSEILALIPPTGLPEHKIFISQLAEHTVARKIGFEVLNYPFGMGQLIETLRMSVIYYMDAELERRRQEAAVPVKIILPMEVLALTSQGAIVKSPDLWQVGELMSFQNDDYKMILGEDHLLKVDGCEPMNDLQGEEAWRVYLSETSTEGSSRTKFWQKILKNVSEFKQSA